MFQQDYLWLRTPIFSQMKYSQKGYFLKITLCLLNKILNTNEFMPLSRVTVHLKDILQCYVEHHFKPEIIAYDIFMH
jgi:hypothetical protein